MRCPTCGQDLEPGTGRCPACGSAVAVPAKVPVYVQRCPRCGYQGQGVGYFSRAGHVALLVVVSMFTYGLGGLVYWLVRRNHRVCPSCGLGWDNAAFLPAPKGGERLRTGADRQPEPALPSGGLKRRMLGTLMILLGSFLVLMGIVDLEGAMVVAGALTGATGAGSFMWGWQATQSRRQALLTRLQRRVLQLATVRGGTLTVTEVAADLDLSIPAAEKILMAMDDGFRVRSEITQDGIILYEFPEVLHRRRLEPGQGGA